MHSCLGCLRAAPGKDLTTPYTHLGKTEIYSHMLRDCFDLQVSLSVIGECGICEVCVSRLRDANEFKLQVEQSLSELQARLTGLETVKEEPEVELEIEYEPETNNDVLLKAEAIFKEEPTCPEANNLLANNVELYVEKVTADGFVLGSERTLEVAAASNQTVVKESDPEPEFILGDALSDTSATPEQLQDASNTGATSEGQASGNNVNPDEFILGDSLSHTPATPEQPQASNAGATSGRASKKTGDSILRRVLSNTSATASSNTGATRELHPIDSANPYECGRCGARFSKIIILSQHISENHRQKAKKRLPTSAVRTRSTKSKGKVTSKSEAIKVIRSKPKVTEMKETIVKPYSADTKIYSCNVCDNTFSNKSKFYLHLNSHEEKFFSCEFCSKEFSNLGNMREHRRIHTGEKPFICSICARPFAGLAGLIKHKQKHAAEKPYYCELCKKDFGNYHNLKVHKRVHTGEKPYLCEVCDKRFISSSSLIKHKLCHTRGMTGHVIDD